MKKLFFLLAFVALSCNNDDVVLVSQQNPNTAKNGYNPGGTRTDPTKLAKVIFNPGTGSQRTWFFYPNGLLKRIENAQGQILDSFVYDDHNDLVSHTVNGQTAQIFTYDNAHHITWIQTSSYSNAVVFDNNQNNYTVVFYSDQNPSITLTRQYQMNPELLLTAQMETMVNTEDPTDGYTDYGVWASRSNNNLTLIGSIDLLSYTHDDHPNPLKQAILPVCRAMSVLGVGEIQGYFMNAHYESSNNVLTENNDSGGPESQIHSYQYNGLGLPTSRTTQFYYVGQLQATQLTALFYYQGDVIPSNRSR